MSDRRIERATTHSRGKEFLYILDEERNRVKEELSQATNREEKRSLLEKLIGLDLEYLKIEGSLVENKLNINAERPTIR